METQFGYHLIKVADKKDASTVAYDDVKDKLDDYLKQQKVNEQLVQYIGQLKSGAKIRDLYELMAADAADFPIQAAI